MKINQSQTRSNFPLSEKKIVKKTVTGSIAYTILFLIIWGVSFGILSSEENFSNWIGIITVSLVVLLFTIFIINYLYQRLYFASYFYNLTSDFIQIKKGVVTPKEITIPYERIQDVYVDQDLFDRIFGLYDVHLSSATFASGMAAHIDGVEKEAAEGLREALLQTVKERISKNSTSSVSINQ